MDPSTSVRVFHHIVTMNSDHIQTTMTLDTFLKVTLDTIVTFVILMVALLGSSHVMWRRENFWNFGVIHKVHISNLVLIVSVIQTDSARVRFFLLRHIVRISPELLAVLAGFFRFSLVCVQEIAGIVL
jgi:hypothetical protein